jgi:hypothetical protein
MLPLAKAVYMPGFASNFPLYIKTGTISLRHGGLWKAQCNLACLGRPDATFAKKALRYGRELGPFASEQRGDIWRS